MPCSITIEAEGSCCTEDAEPMRLETLVSPVGPGRFRIEEVCGLVKAFRDGDVIEAEALPDGAWRFRRVIERGCSGPQL
jgi:hypothetical protein